MTLGGLLAILALVGGGLVALAVQRRSARLRSTGKGLLISYATIVLLLAASEAYFRFFYADSAGRGASDNWTARYWHTNAEGFRDREWTPEDWAGKTTVAVVGDSFTAGWGINDPADRFSDVLAARLGGDYAVFNLGVAGSSTPQELELLRGAPDPTPDVVILQYFLNDIDNAVLSLGLPIPEKTMPPITGESYLADFLYERLSGGFGDEYWATEYANYDNYVIWDVHQQQINTFIDTVESTGARLIMVIFPNMQDPVRSIAYVDRVAQVFEARGQTAILKLYDAVAARNPADVVVSPRDGHASASFHHLVGDILYERFFAP